MRIKSLDLLKSIGIIAFIIWHCYVNYYGNMYYNSPFMRATLFATGLFVFLSGTTLGFHYYDKFSLQAFPIIKKLCIRCVKLLAIVFTSNMLISYLKNKQSIIPLMLFVIKKITSLIYVDRWDISLQVLLVISAGMLINCLFMAAYMKYGKPTLLIVTILLVGFFLIDATNQSHYAYLWRYLPLSCTGAIVGLLFREALLNGLVTKNHLISLGVVFIAIFFSLWLRVCFSLQFSRTIINESMLYCIFILSLTIGVGALLYYNLDYKKKSLPMKKISYIMGQYSLFVYILQIVIINLSLLVIGNKSYGSDFIIISASIIIILTCLGLTLITDKLRSNIFIDKLYRIIFA